MTRTQNAEVDVNEALKAVSTSSAAMCAQICLALQGKWDN